MYNVVVLMVVICTYTYSITVMFVVCCAALVSLSV